jgi:hypothetical protein
MKTVKIIGIFSISIFFTFSCNNNNINSKSTNVLSALNYDKVVAYNYDGEDGNEIIDDSGYLSKTVTRQAVLTKNQITNINEFLCDKSTYGGNVAACFEPHLGIVYYKKNKVVCYISICLGCNLLVSSIKIPEASSGFSDVGASKIISLCQELKFGILTN